MSYELIPEAMKVVEFLRKHGCEEIVPNVFFSDSVEGFYVVTNRGVYDFTDQGGHLNGFKRFYLEYRENHGLLKRKNL